MCQNKKINNKIITIIITKIYWFTIIFTSFKNNPRMMGFMGGGGGENTSCWTITHFVIHPFYVRTKTTKTKIEKKNTFKIEKSIHFY